MQSKQGWCARRNGVFVLLLDGSLVASSELIREIIQAMMSGSLLFGFAGFVMKCKWQSPLLFFFSRYIRSKNVIREIVHRVCQLRITPTTHTNRESWVFLTAGIGINREFCYYKTKNTKSTSWNNKAAKKLRCLHNTVSLIVMRNEFSHQPNTPFYADVLSSRRILVTITYSHTHVAQLKRIIAFLVAYDSITSGVTVQRNVRATVCTVAFGIYGRHWYLSSTAKSDLIGHYRQNYQFLLDDGVHGSIS